MYISHIEFFFVDYKEEFDVKNVRASHKFEKMNYRDLPNEADDLMFFMRSIDFIQINNNLIHYALCIRHRLGNIE